jgi:uncharacterized membrane protein
MFQTSSNNQTNKSFSDSDFKEKLFGSLSYLTGGIFGFILLIINRGRSNFLRYHIYQSIVICLLFILLREAAKFLFFVLTILPLPASADQVIWKIMPWILEGILILYLGVIIYCVFTLCRNQYTWIKWISAQISKML